MQGMLRRFNLWRAAGMAVLSVASCQAESPSQATAYQTEPARCPDCASGPLGFSVREVGDDVASGQGRSRVSLGPIGRFEMRTAFTQAYLQASPGRPEEIVLSYSAVLANGDALSLVLPYSGSPLTFDAASVPIGGDGLMWSVNGGADMFSTRGTFRVERTDEGLAVVISDLVLSQALSPDESIVVGEGVVEGQLERRCLLAKPNDNGPRGPNGPAIDYERDPSWTSEYCAQYR